MIRRSLWLVPLALLALTGTANAWERSRVSSVTQVSGAKVKQVLVRGDGEATYKLRIRNLDPPINAFCLQVFEQSRHHNHWRTMTGGGLCFGSSESRRRLRSQVTIGLEHTRRPARLLGVTDLGASLKLRL